MHLLNKSPLARVIAALLVAFLFTASIREIRGLSSSAPDFVCSTQTSPEVTIEIRAGQTGSSIAQELLALSVVKSSESFFRAAVSDPRSARIAPGSHRLNTRICSQQALNQLLDPKRTVGLISISEGMWISEIVPQMVSAGFVKSEILKAIAQARKPTGFNQVEGLLFPAQYSFEKNSSPADAISSMVKRSEIEMQRAGFFVNNSKFTPQQLLTIASLVQAEGDAKDFAKISQVIRNRLKKGMPLQFDSTVHYVKKSRGSVFLSTQSTLINSPYNTYRKYGLPPGPINNPGASAMRAAMTPEEGDWLYFITVAPFDTRFTSDVNQFSLWKIEYKKNLRAGKFRSKK